MQEKCAGHQRLTLRFRRVHGRFAQQDLRLLASNRTDLTRITGIVAAARRARALRERNFVATRHCQSERHHLFAPPFTADRPCGTHRLPDPVQAAREANSPRQIGRLVSAAVPFTRYEGCRTKGVALLTPRSRRLSVGADFVFASTDPSLARPDSLRAGRHGGCSSRSREDLRSVFPNPTWQATAQVGLSPGAKGNTLGAKLGLNQLEYYAHVPAVIDAAATADGVKVTKKLPNEVVIGKAKVSKEAQAAGKVGGGGAKKSKSILQVAVLQPSKTKAVSMTNAFVAALGSYAQLQFDNQTKQADLHPAAVHHEPRRTHSPRFPRSQRRPRRSSRVRPRRRRRRARSSGWW